MTDKPITYAWAINHALAEEMERDPSIIMMGQDIGRMGGVYGVTRGLLDRFGADRVRDVSIVEHFLVGGAVGAAIGGLRPVIELQFADFMLLAGDEVFHKLAKWRYIHGGVLTLPVVLRAPSGVQGGAGAEHSQSLEGYCWHTPGLKIAVPATPTDAKGLLKTAIRDDNPVIFFEHRRLYRVKGQVPSDPNIRTPFGQAEVRRVGTQLTIVAWSAMVATALAAADRLAELDVDVEVVDPRTLVPFDWDTVDRSVRKTSRLLIVHESTRTAGPGAEVAAHAADLLFDCLDAPVRRVAGADIPIPQSAELEPCCYPQVDEVVTAALELSKW